MQEEGNNRRFSENAGAKTSPGRFFYLANYGALTLFGALFILASARGNSGGGNFTEYYLNFLFSSFKNGFLWIFGAIAVYALIKLTASFLGHAFFMRSPAAFFKKVFSRNSLSFIFRGAKNLLVFCGPAVLSYIVAGFSFGKIGFLNLPRLNDEIVLSWDKSLTGAYPFMALGNVRYPPWIFGIISWSFDALPLFATVFAFYLALRNVRRLQEYATAFSLVLLFMTPIWLIYPALSPQDRFLDNVYKLPVASELQLQITNYRPQKELRDFLADVRLKKNNLEGVMPTTTFPSAHVAWAVLLFIYAMRDRKILGWIIVPVALFSTFGTVVLAQHYFVDVPAGLAFGLAVAAIVWAEMR